ncbi:MAG: Flp family type IVb pilin [Desulfuromonadales bacterium]|nr:Flp family type IVb pilin [Desulfuromonadales bacterium]
MEWVKRFLKDEEGATAVEYGLMVALIAAVIIVGAKLLGDNTNAKFSEVAGKVQGAGGTTQ